MISVCPFHFQRISPDKIQTVISNPDKLGKIDNHKQEPWKAPLPQFIEHIYFKRFKREEPETVKPLKQILKEMETKKKLQKEKKEERRKQRSLFSDSAAE